MVSFYHSPHPLIDGAPWNDATSLTTLTLVSDNFIYSSNPWESNHRDGPTGHKKPSSSAGVTIIDSVIISETVLHVVLLTKLSLYNAKIELLK